MTVLDIVRPEIRRLRSYDAASQVDRYVRLNANEASWNDDNNAGLNRYPEVRPIQLRDAMAAHYGVRSDSILVTRGSSEAIDVIMRTFCRTGVDNIVLPAPTFGMYRVYAELQGAEVRNVPTSIDENFLIDVDKLLAAADENTKLFFIGSPNNPTGCSVNRADILRMADARVARSIVIVDEAYIEFSDHESVCDMIAEFKNLVVLRTTSKAMALAGTRCGCAIADEELVRVLDSVLPPYSVPTPISNRVAAALAPDRVAANDVLIQQTCARREKLATELRQLASVKKVVESDANFLLVRFDNAPRAFRACMDAGILLRDLSAVEGLENCLRISIGSEQDTELLLASLCRLG